VDAGHQPRRDDPVRPRPDIVAQHSYKLVDINGGSTSAGAATIQWSATGGLNQVFDFVDAGGGHYRIRARHSGLVLQVATSSSGADITQQADTNSPSRQSRLAVGRGFALQRPS
jgi:beta-galactosidase